MSDIVAGDGPPPEPAEEGGDPPCWAHLFEDDLDPDSAQEIDHTD